jgi:hypothetical protein
MITDKEEMSFIISESDVDENGTCVVPFGVKKISNLMFNIPVIESVKKLYCPIL